MNKILLVEDDTSIVRSLSEFLKSEGFSVRQTDTQSEAVRLASSETFDLVLMDIALSQGNGFAACACRCAGRLGPCDGYGQEEGTFPDQLSEERPLYWRKGQCVPRYAAA